MKRFASAAALGALAASAVQATQHVEGVVSWETQRRALDQRPGRIRRRADSLQTDIANELYLGGYFVSCEVGTPAQKLTLQLDTGSSDIWVPATSASVCKSGSCSLGSFTSGDSSTFNDTGPGQFDITYVDRTSSKGDYFSDVFRIDNQAIKNMTMGLGLETGIAYGLVGIGYQLNEAIVGDTSSTSSAYPNLPVSMVSSGLIKSVAYSLWLNDLDASTGNILFGGIDTDKYQGDLTKIKVYPTTSGSKQFYTSFIVALTSVLGVSSTGTDTLTSASFPIPVVLDSGTTLSYLPADIAQEIWNEVGAVYDSEHGIAVIPCDMRTSKGYFSFGLGGVGGPVINVTMDELVLDMSDPAPTFGSGQYKGQDACQLGIQQFNSSSSTFLLGDTFLRSAYVVYDLVNNEIALAPTRFNASSSNVVAFTSSGQAIPSATEAPSQAAVTATQPANTTPAYAAKDGFINSKTASGAGGTALAGVAMFMAALGAGLFVWI